MKSHYDLSDVEFEQQFEDMTLKPGLFSHEAHLRLAWIHICKYGVVDAIEHMRKQIRRFAEHHGANDKYNDTVTVAAVRAVDHFMRKQSHDTFRAFISENSTLLTEFRDLIASHYSWDVFKDPSARVQYQEPDLSPFETSDHD